MPSKILVVEDDIEQFDFLEELLEDDKLSFRHYAIDGKTKEEIADYFFSEQYDMLLVDHDLSNAAVGYTGAEFIDYMFSKCPQVQMLVLTANDQDAMSHSTRPLLVQARPTKPEEWEYLKERVKKGCLSYKKAVIDAERQLKSLARKDALTKDQQILYAKVSNFLTQISYPMEEIVNSLEGKTVASKINELATSLKKIEVMLETHHA